MKDIIRMKQLAGLITENQAMEMMNELNEGKYSNWWAKANKELGLDFENDIYSYVDLYDEPWQGEFARKVTSIEANNYEDFKNKVDELYNELNPF